MLQLYYVLSLEPFGALRNSKFDGVSLVEGLEAGSLDSGVMDKDIVSRGSADKSISFFVVKPLYCTLFSHISFSNVSTIPALQDCYWIAFLLMIFSILGNSLRIGLLPSRVCSWRCPAHCKHLIEQNALYNIYPSLSRTVILLTRIIHEGSSRGGADERGYKARDGRIPQAYSTVHREIRPSATQQICPDPPPQ
jgi:hypothetical protein